MSQSQFDLKTNESPGSSSIKEELYAICRTKHAQECFELLSKAYTTAEEKTVLDKVKATIENSLKPLIQQGLLSKESINVHTFAIEFITDMESELEEQHRDNEIATTDTTTETEIKPTSVEPALPSEPEFKVKSTSTQSPMSPASPKFTPPPDMFIEMINVIDCDISINPSHAPLVFQAGETVTFGDLHGNAHKLLYLLGLYGFISPADGVFNELHTLYYKDPSSLTTQDLIRYTELIENLFEQCDAESLGKIRFIGDLLADRGSNDFFTLTILEQLYKKDLVLANMASNHDHAFFMVTFFQERYFDGEHIAYQQSFENMLGLVNLPEEKGFHPQNRINALVGSVSQFYQKHVKLIDYEQDDEKKSIRFYSHSPVFNFDLIVACAKEWKIDTTNQPLLDVIDAINDAFSTHFMDFIRDPFSYPSTNEIVQGRYNPKDEALAKKVGEYSMMHIHGHEIIESKYAQNDNRFNALSLDDNLGKTPKLKKGTSTQIITNNPAFIKKLEEKQTTETTETPPPASPTSPKPTTTSSTSSSTKPTLWNEQEEKQKKDKLSSSSTTGKTLPRKPP